MKQGTAIQNVLRLAAYAGLIAIFHLTTCTLQAQKVETRHSCWDIDIVPTYPEYKSFDSFNNHPSLLPNAIDTADLVIDYASKYIGTPYRYGGRTPKGFDCAGFARFVFLRYGHDLPGWCSAQAQLGKKVDDTHNLKRGDLVFFGGRHNTKTIGHTGIVVEADSNSGTFRFIHASTTAGVIISHSSEPYYKQRYITARRILR